MDPIVCPCLSSSLSVVERQDCAGSRAVMCADSVSEMAMEPYFTHFNCCYFCWNMVAVKERSSSSSSNVLRINKITWHKVLNELRQFFRPFLGSLPSISFKLCRLHSEMAGPNRLSFVEGTLCDIRLIKGKILFSQPWQCFVHHPFARSWRFFLASLTWSGSSSVS